MYNNRYEIGSITEETSDMNLEQEKKMRAEHPSVNEANIIIFKNE